MVDAPLTNKAYGYPSRGDARRIAPRRLVCIHVTANPNTPPATAQQERDYANRAGSNGPSAHSYLNRDGSWVHAIDPDKYAAWSNGALRSPRTSVAGVSEVVALQASGKNPNEDYYREVECCGRYPDYPLTAEQRTELAQVIAEDSLRTGLPISRSTVHLHSDLDSEQKPNCPVPAGERTAFVTGIIAAANTVRDRLYIAQLEEERSSLLGQLGQAHGTILDLREEAGELLAEISRSHKQREEAVAWGKALQSYGAQILATDKPEWVE